MHLRFVNVQTGSVLIDGYNIGKVGLSTLRRRLALVPQESTLFLGTLRENLYVYRRLRMLNSTKANMVPRDPQATRTDDELIEALKRSWLLPREGPVDPATEAKFSLDAAVTDEGKLICVCNPGQL